jgi:hypothetical protein
LRSSPRPKPFFVAFCTANSYKTLIMISFESESSEISFMKVFNNYLPALIVIFLACKKTEEPIGGWENHLSK